LPGTMLSPKGLKVRILGEWMGRDATREIQMGAGEIIEGIGPFSCFSAIQMDQQYGKRRRQD